MIKRNLYKRCLTFLLLITIAAGAWGQTDYSGVYYIGSVGYNAGTPANNYYLCPTEGWCYYQATDDFTGTDNGMPFLTTYKCKTNNYHSGNPNDAIWIIEKAPAPNSAYYYIKQASTGRYLTSNGTIRTTGNADRMRIHLEAVAPENLDDKELFTITPSSTHLTISPKGVVGGADDRNWLTVNGGNKNALTGQSGKQNGPTGYTNTAGIIGIYTQDDTNAPFYLENALSIDAPTITNNYDGTFTITAATGATIYYTTDGTYPTTSTLTTGTTSVNVSQTESMTVIKAIAKAASDPFPTNVTTYSLPVCDRPTITQSGNIITITSTTEGAAIRYTTDGSSATSSSTLYTGPFDKGSANEIRAIATKPGYVISSETTLMPPTEVSSSDQITDMSGNYILASNFSSNASVGTSSNPFTGTIDGNMNPLTLSYPLVAYADGAIIKNVILNNENVTISGNENGNAGAICCEATGDTRIYNCGVLSGSVGGSNKVGGIVGLLDGSARVINCYSYANISSGSDCGGIVGYNNVASTSGNLQTMVMNCMFYGNITGENAAPVYGGEIIHNKYASADDTGLNNYCYFLYDEEKVPYVKTIASGKFHGALGAEERFLNRFELFRMTLNSTRNLAAYYVTGDVTRKNEMAKWVLDKSIAPYPILKSQGNYPSVINPDAAHATAKEERNKGGLLGTLSVTIGGVGSGAQFAAPSGASITRGSLTLNITDKDYDNFNYNYKKVQLPYYNDVGSGNYTDGRVVTGWKITSITGGTPGSFTTDTYDYPSFNFVDRKCTNKDLYSVSKRVFAQGAYWEVPDGVTAIEIEPYWAKAVYLSDANYDVTYTITISGTGSSATATATKYGVTVCGSCPTVCKEQTVYNTITDATNALQSNASHTVYDYAVVLVGNYHQAANDALINNGKPVTFMSADLDGDNEPDNTLFYYHNQRRRVSHMRFDFLNIPGIGMMKRTHDSSMDPEPGIFAPQGWFEITNTVLIRFGQFEYAGSNSFTKTILAPLILQGGIYEQFVSCTRTNAQNTNYLLIGGNAWFKNFANGCHTNQANKTPKVPINVSGGDYTNFYLTGIYQPLSNEDSENAECYIDGGRFTEVAGAGMQQIKGDVTWLINAADITSFYGGGINAAKPITGSISTTISNSYVGEFYGGPKFGDMAENKTVTTNATDCHFGKFFGAGYGGTAFNRVGPVDSSDPADTRGWNGYVSTHYKRAYSADNGGISTNYDYEFILHSDGSQTVARFFVDYASLSLASTRNVTNALSGCTIGTFYGGGSLGAVNGDINSTLTNCTVTDNAFGAGFSASVPTVEVWNAGANMSPNPTYNRTANVFNNASVRTPKDNGQYTVYTWSNSHGSNANPFTDTGDGKHYIYTNVSLDGLGSVSGDVTLTINGTTTVGKSVYGGGEESSVDGNTTVNVTGGTIGSEGLGGAEYGNVYGGGKGKDDDVTAGLVKGNANVSISGSPMIYHNIYGGGAYGSVGTFAYDATTGLPNSLTDETGTCNITITGGTFGSNGKENGMVFGSSRGMEGDPEANSFVDKMAWVGNTNVIIGTQNAESNASPWIKGSVYGGGENGHNFGNGHVTVHSGTIGITEGAEIIDNGGTPDDPSDDISYTGARYPYRGNVYGAGCGTDTFERIESGETKTYYDFNAGVVLGNTTIDIDGGHVVRCVYGGGAMGSVGTFTLADAAYHEAHPEVPVGKPISCAENTGLCTINITGGKIGMTNATMTGHGNDGPDDSGHVFGAGRGTAKDPDQHPNIEITAFFNNTNVNISDNAFVCGSVYGGSESGHVLNDTRVTVSGGQVGCGVGRSAAYTDDEFASSTSLPGTNHWTYTAADAGAPYDQYANSQGKYPDNSSTEGGLPIATDGHTFYGNVFGGGSGYYPYAPGKWLRSAGRVEGTATVTISGGHILNNVYGGCEMADIEGTATVSMSGGTVGVPRSATEIKALPTIGNVYGAGMGDKRIFFNTSTNVASTTVSITGGTVYGSVYGGGEDGHVLDNATTTISKETGEGKIAPVIGCDGTSGYDGNVFGGGQGSSTALTAGVVGGNVNLGILDGSIKGSVYGGGRIGSVGTYFAMVKTEDPDNPGQMIDNPYYGKMQDGVDHGYLTVNLKGGTIEQNVYGGCMGTNDDVRLGISKNIVVNLNDYPANEINTVKGCAVKGSIFGCNNVNSSPQGNVTVHVHATQNAAATQIANTSGETPVTNAKVKGRYDVMAVYGGGNLAAYEPTDLLTGKTHVIIDGCGLTSVRQVYGGGNAASTPATSVTINGTYEIEEVFGGGNGFDALPNGDPNPGANVGYKDYHLVENNPEYATKEVRVDGSAFAPYRYGTGKAAVNIFGGTIHRVFGGSNTKGNVRHSVITTLDENSGCEFCVDEAYGGGKSAPMDAEVKMMMACIPGLKAAYGGAEEADVQGDVTLNITNGNFDRVFGGNNISGTIGGTITVNIEETGCHLITIGQLYGGGNQAAYTGPLKPGSTTERQGPTLNVRSFSSIGEVYGGGYGKTATVTGDTYVNINVCEGKDFGASQMTEVARANTYTGYRTISFTEYRRTDNGGFAMDGSSNRIIDTREVNLFIPPFTSGIGAINTIYGGGNAAKVVGNTHVNIGTATGNPVVFETPTSADEASRTHTVKGANIKGNVYGGGNAAEVTGKTFVQIGKKIE